MNRVGVQRVGVDVVEHFLMGYKNKSLFNM